MYVYIIVCRNSTHESVPNLSDKIEFGRSLRMWKNNGAGYSDVDISYAETFNLFGGQQDVQSLSGRKISFDITRKVSYLFIVSPISNII